MMDFLDLLGQAELSGGDSEETAASRPGPISRLRQSHHFLARTLAEGRADADAAALTGYSLSHVRKLKDDPTFQELLEHYRVQVLALSINWEDRIGALAGSFLDELQYRLEEKPESFSNKELREAFVALGDRSVAPSKSKAGAPLAGPGAVSVKINFVGPPTAMTGPTHPVLDLTPVGDGV